MQHGTIFGTQPYGLPLGETTTPQYLKSLGYATRGVGKVLHFVVLRGGRVEGGVAG